LNSKVDEQQRAIELPIPNIKTTTNILAKSQYISKVVTTNNLSIPIKFIFNGFCYLIMYMARPLEGLQII